MKSLWLCAVLLCSPLQSIWADNKPELMLANVYSSQSHKIELQNYWVSEKFDGVRAFWDGKQFISRQGNAYNAPSWFVANLPLTPLDGELWLDRGQFDRLSGIVRKQVPIDNEWLKIRYMVFDMPKHLGNFDQRLNELSLLEDLPSWVEVVKQWKVKNEVMLLQQLDTFVEQGAEGLMLHDGRSLYSAKRSNDLIKLKPSLDSEAIVLSYVEGKGKYRGKMGALWVEAVISNPDGAQMTKMFKIGSGFSDHDRDNPPEIGSEITFKYSGLTSQGTPRFARYWRLRNKKAK
jgi:DNA ligase-1